jgi:predicted transcriptional regulator
METINRRTNSDLERQLPPVAYFIRQERKRLCMTQEEFAKHAKVGIAFLKRLEAGDENLHMGKVIQVLRAINADLYPKQTQN